MVHSKQQAPLPSHSVTGLTNWTISGDAVPGFANRFDPHLDIPKLPPEGTQGLVDSDDALVDAAYVSWGPVTNVQRPVRLYINTGDYVIMTWNNEQNRLQISVAGITAGHRVKVYPWIGGSQLGGGASTDTYIDEVEIDTQELILSYNRALSPLRVDISD